MLTDTPPRNTNRAGFLESDRIKSLDLPQESRLPSIAKNIEFAMKSGTFRLSGRSTSSSPFPRTKESKQISRWFKSLFLAARVLDTAHRKCHLKGRQYFVLLRLPLKNMELLGGQVVTSIRQDDAALDVLWH
jgi:hypothetical protein